MPAPTFQHFTDAAYGAPPEIAVVLGSGMGHVTRRLQRLHTVSFHDVPGLVAASVSGHAGRLTLATWAERRVLVFEGRLHRYEGHPWERVVEPVRLAHQFGARVLIVTNAAGGIHEALQPGSFMAIGDQIDWLRPYCWRLPGAGGIGAPRPSPYAERLLEQLLVVAAEQGVRLHKGVYAAVTGPCYETPAEIRALRACGASAVGMSTVREVQLGCDLGMECAGISCITNRAAGLGSGPLRHDEVLTAAAAQAERLADLLEEFVRRV